MVYLIPSIIFLCTIGCILREKILSLTQTEVDRIYNKEFHNQRLIEIRNPFVFCRYTGLSFADISTLKESDIQPTFDSQEWILIRQSKTDLTAHIPLLSVPLAITNKYRKALGGETLFPIKCNQKANSHLKEIADLGRITKNITFHMARCQSYMQL